MLRMTIKAQLEDLFTDSHLAEDGFLLKHVRKNKQGYVSLKLLTCLKKVKRKKRRRRRKKQDFMCFLWCLHSFSLNKNNRVKCKQS